MLKVIPIFVKKYNMNISTEININALPSKVWAVFTNFQEYPNWNPFIHSLQGVTTVGEQIKIQLPDMAFKPTILSYSTNKEMSWLGHLFFKGLFDGLHKFELKDNQDGTTTFVHSEQFSGLLVPLFKNKLKKDTLDGFKAMNQSLKERVEVNID